VHGQLHSTPPHHFAAPTSPHHRAPPTRPTNAPHHRVHHAHHHRAPLPPRLHIQSYIIATRGGGAPPDNAAAAAATTTTFNVSPPPPPPPSPVAARRCGGEGGVKRGVVLQPTGWGGAVRCGAVRGGVSHSSRILIATLAPTHTQSTTHPTHKQTSDRHATDLRARAHCRRNERSDRSNGIFLQPASCRHEATRRVRQRCDGARRAASEAE
jgi:hypothetical protein